MSNQRGSQGWQGQNQGETKEQNELEAQTPGRQGSGAQNQGSSKSSNTPGRKDESQDSGSCGCDSTQGSTMKQKNSSGGSQSDND